MAEGGIALRAGALGTEVVIAVDARGMAVVKGDLNGVIADLRGGLGSGFGLVHLEERRGLQLHVCHFLLFVALVVAGGAGALVAEIGEVVMTGVAVGPRNVHARTTAHVNLYRCGLFPLINGCWHLQDFLWLQQSPGGMGLPCGQVVG